MSDFYGAEPVPLHILAALQRLETAFKAQSKTKIELYGERLTKHKLAEDEIKRAVNTLLDTASHFPSISEIVDAARPIGETCRPGEQAPIFDAVVALKKDIEIQKSWKLEGDRRGWTLRQLSDIQREIDRLERELGRRERCREAIAHGVDEKVAAEEEWHVKRFWDLPITGGPLIGPTDGDRPRMDS